MTNRSRGPSGPAAEGRRRPGRPLGSVALTKQVEATILSYIRAGAFDHVAAEAAGISARTFRDWMARGEGRHASRPSTARLRAFAEEVRRAKAEVRLAAEARVYREQPAYWLSRVAKSTPEREGWTDPGRDAGRRGSSHDPAPDDGPLGEEFDRLLEAMLVSGDATVPPCSHPRCRCPYHRRRKP